MKQPIAPDDFDLKLMDLLRANARASITTLAQTLGVARATVQERLRRLENNGAIVGYTIATRDQVMVERINAMVLITTDSKLNIQVVRALEKRPSVRKLFTISGNHDLCAFVSADTTDALDIELDGIRETRGVVDTLSSILLSTKVNR